MKREFVRHVYAPYRLTREEIKLVEESDRK
jgi:hypothetical protein